MKTNVTPAQLRVLHAASRVEVSKPATGISDPHTWRAGGRSGRAVTVPVEALISKSLVKPADEAADDGRLYIVVTQAGYALLSQEARHG